MRIVSMIGSFGLLALLGGCGSTWKAITDVDLDGDGKTVDDGDCWDGPEGPVGSGLSGADIHPGAEDIACDGIDQNCDLSDDFDQDGDGDIALQCAGTDCDDTDAAINGAATEIWYDGIDQNCDANDMDQDGDGFACASAPDENGYCEGDCNDLDANQYPNDSAETYYDGIDSNCDGADDFDADGDGYRSAYYDNGSGFGNDCLDQADDVFANPAGLNPADVHPDAQETYYDGTDQNCAADSDYDADQDGQDRDSDGGTDCNDADDQIYYGADETWYDGIDQGCDGDNDNDADSDGVDSSAYGGTDCNDSDPLVFPGTTENCSTAYDDNCDGLTNSLGAENGIVFYADVDGDGVGDINSTPQIWCGSGDAASHYTATVNTDCDDTDSHDYPGAVETIGNSDDEDCDGTEICYEDDDNDGYLDSSGDTRDAGVDKDCNDANEGTNTDPLTDCNDADAAIHPGATEICDANDVDEDCDGLADDADTSASGKQTYYVDTDGDGYGGINGTLYCNAPASTSLINTDCDDTDALDYPGANETIGNGDDEDCNGGEICYDDDDNDGYLDATNDTRVSADADCADANEGTNNDPTTDCLDTDATYHPGATEVVGDSRDENCDGLETCYLDNDNDGYRPDTTSTLASADSDCSDTREALSTDPTTDCNDASASINPVGTEICDAANTDEDCDGTSDDADLNVLQSSKSVFYVDGDLDGYGATATSRCDLASGFVSQSGDCNDGNAAISPGDPEVCDTLDVDEDCDGVADDLDNNVTGKITYYRDADGDSYGVSTTSVQQCSQPAGYVGNSSDCLDTDVQAYPGATEWCDGHVNNCNNSGTWTAATENGLVTLINGSTYTNISSQWSGNAAYNLPATGTINVCGGTYNVRLTTSGNTTDSNVDIVGYNAPVITNSTAGSLLQVYNTPGRNHQVRVYDMTFTGGLGSAYNYESYGGNVLVYDTDGIYATDSQGRPAQLLLDGCTISGGTSKYGGGIAIGVTTGGLYGRVELVDTVVSGNGGTSTLQGGGIYIQSNGYLTCENSDITTNTAALNGSAHGGGVYLVGSAAVTTFISSTGCDWGTGATENLAGASNSLTTSDIEGSGLYPNPYNVAGVQTSAFTCTGSLCQ